MYKLQQQAPTPKKVEPSSPVFPKPEFCDSEYHGPLSNLEATKILKDEGQYLIRKSSRSSDTFYTLTLRYIYFF